MERDDRSRDPLELDGRYREAAVERAIAHVQREFLAPELSGSQWSALDGLPDPKDERPCTRRDEDSYFARESASAVRELAETVLLREQVPNLCRLVEGKVDPFVSYFNVWRAEELLARLQNRPPCLPIIRFIGPPEYLGFFNPRNPQIGINQYLLLLSDPRDLLKAYLHEARHAFQFHAIKHPEAHPDLHPSTIAEWTRASMTYRPLGLDPTPAEVEAYENHLLEIDARAYVEHKMRQLDGR